MLRENRRFIQNEAYAPETDVLTKVVSFLCDVRASGGGEPARAVHIVTENVGHGLIADLLLGHMLLSLNIAAKVHYHSKPFSCGDPYLRLKRTFWDTLSTWLTRPKEETFGMYGILERCCANM